MHSEANAAKGMEYRAGGKRERKMHAMGITFFVLRKK